jgi:hypothetical protein
LPFLAFLFATSVINGLASFCFAFAQVSLRTFIMATCTVAGWLKLVSALYKPYLTDDEKAT